MAKPVIMPKFEMSQEVGTVVEWLKKDGETVKQGEAILVVETDKVTMEVESPAAGILAGTRGAAGEEIPVTEVIGYILKEGESLPEAAPKASKAVSEPKPEPAKESVSVEPVEAAKATPVAERIAKAHNIDLSTVAGSGTKGKITKTDVEAVVESGSAPEARPEAADKVRATPAARRVAREEGVDLQSLTGSGPRQRIQEVDVVKLVTAVQPVAREMAEVEVVPFAGMRKKIADRLTLSYQTAPHIYLTIKADMTEFDALRKKLNEKAKSTNGPHVSATALLVKIAAWVLKRNPWINSTLKEDHIELIPQVNVGMAVALDQGLIVPVIHDADLKGVGQLSAEVNDLAVRAREGQLVPAEVMGGTFTISNLGQFGIEQFTAIINPGQTAILAVGAIQKELVPGEDDEIEIRPMMRMTLSADHRVIDGAVAARFLSELCEALESPAVILW